LVVDPLTCCKTLEAELGPVANKGVFDIPNFGTMQQAIKLVGLGRVRTIDLQEDCPGDSTTPSLASTSGRTIVSDSFAVMPFRAVDKMDLK